MTNVLSNPPKNFRASIARGSEAVDREGGQFGAGLITGVSVIARGEALGHDLWVDTDFLADVTAAINSSQAENGGVKARFTHPGLSSDGLGTRLGRVVNATTVGDRVLADLHILESAHNTPDGDLASYVMGLAEEDPDSFGVSVVFERDMDAEKEHVLDSTEAGVFVSPDESNRDNLPHARLQRLRAADVVDDPAANPDGLFCSQQEAASKAEAFVSYALGLSDEKPGAAMFGTDPDRASGFVARFLSRHNLRLERADMPAEVQEEVTAQPTRDEFAAELSKFTEAFGSERGVAWFNAGVDFDSAEAVFDDMQSEVDSLNDTIGELNETIKATSLGEDEPAEFQEGDSAPEQPRTFTNRIRLNGKNYED